MAERGEKLIISSPVFSLQLGTKTMIVLSSDLAVKDVLDKRSGNYSDRPDMFIGQKVASGDLRLVVMRYADTWRGIHRMIHNILNMKAAVTYTPYQDLENKIMLKGFLEEPQIFLDHVRRYTFSLSTQLIFGYRCPDMNDANLKELFNFANWGELAASGSAQILDLFPILQKLPKWLAPNVKYAESLFKKESAHYLRMWMRAKEGLRNGDSHPCFCNDLLRAQEKENFTDAQASYISGSLLEAGSDTTAATIYGFIQAMLVWPEVLKKAQEEVDRVVGPDRMPTIEDYENLPYIRCCIKESIRWMPTVILGVPHAAIKEDSYNGYVIPAGATIINNVWSIHMDPRRSPNPRTFNPDRFAGDFTTLYQSATGDCTKRDNFVFGAGRRLCQGIHIAERSLFLAISRLAWGFNFSPSIGEDGKPITYNVDDLVGGITVEPRHYTCRIECRSTDKARIIREEAQMSQDLLNSETGQWKESPKGMAFSTWVPEKTEA
ncbi:hypothetical protein LTR64_002276 [Lithohypha guttulata]|uniref:uncharacterized protein n=1 Tax=Lithohypha guttulata TaxID=1690604 RepID=UPI002DDF35A4|nr:hypothetical protein LTR51_001497 [Lithohypha guttulata]